MTVEPQDRKWRLNVWTRQPVRKLRFKEPVGDDALADLQNTVGMANSRLYGILGSGNYVVIPGDNVAYIEAVEL